jgi:hypothetical protein
MTQPAGALAGGQIGQGAFATQFGALSRQKSGVEQQYADDQSGLKGQLALLERQRADQKEAQDETRRADRERITDLERQKKAIEEGIAAQRKGLEEQLKAAEKAKKAVEEADSKRRQALEDDIKRNESGKANALAQYNIDLQRIEAQQQRNSLLDAAAEAQRKLDLAPYQQELDATKEKEEAALAPLLQRKEVLDAERAKYQEDKAAQEQRRQAAEAEAAALKDAGAGAGALNDNLAKTAPLGSAAALAANGIGVALTPDSPFVTFLKRVNDELKTLADWVDTKVVPAVTRFGNWLKGDGLKGVTDLGGWLSEHFTPALRDLWKVLSTDLPPVLKDLSHIVGTVLVFDFQQWKTVIDTLIAPTLKLLIDTMTFQLHVELVALHKLLDGEVFAALGRFWEKVNSAEIVVGDFHGTLKGAYDWLAANWSSIEHILTNPFVNALSPITAFFTALDKGLSWLGKTFHLNVTPLNLGSGSDNGIVSPDGGAGTGSFGTIPGHAAGLRDSPDGHLAVVGEKGPEIRWINKGDTIIPNDLSKAMGLLPGHADGLNLDAIGDFVKGAGGLFKAGVGAVVDRVMGGLGNPGLDGVMEGASGALLDMVKGGMLTWLKGSPDNAAQNLGRAFARFGGTASGDGFADMAFDDYIAYTGQFPGWWDNRGAFDTLMAVSKERNVNPRWPMAVAAQEIGMGTTNPGLASIFNFWGMGYHDSPWDHPSGSAASDFGPSDYAAYSSFHDSLEDIDDYIAAHGTGWGDGYSTDQGAAGAKRAIFDSIVGMTPVPGGGLAGASAGGGYPEVFADAQAHLGEMFHAGHEWNLWCEQFAELAGEDVGFPHLGWATALAHAQGVQLNGGVGPPGSTMLWGSGYYPDGHAAISAGDGSVIGTSSRGIQQYDMGGAADYRGWAPPGLKDGAYVTSPTLAMIGEGRSPEIVAPEPKLREAVRDGLREAGGGGIAIYGGLNVYPAAGREGSDILDSLTAEARRRGMRLNGF